MADTDDRDSTAPGHRDDGEPVGDAGTEQPDVSTGPPRTPVLPVEGVTERPSPGSRPKRVELPSGRVPFAAHESRSVAEAGIELPPAASRIRWRWVVAVSVVVLVVVAWVLGRSPGGTDVVTLPVGTCHTPAPSERPADVAAVDCERSHDGQLVAAFVSPEGPEVPFPGDDELLLFGQATCQEPAEAITGSDLGSLAADGVVLRLAPPTREAWDDGDRDIACSLVDADGAALEGSLATAG